KGIKYSCGEFAKSVNNDEIVNALLENTIESGEEFVGKKQVILVEMDSNYCEEEKMLIILNDLLMKIQDSNKESYETIFSLYIREKSQEKIKIGLVCN
ncbi:MAG: hypothetical protein ACRCW0_01140, partial [Clostridium sp.]